ncbi:MAG: hypothetical protein RL291_1875 [Pseudomonadota bacterium]|jgi:hypothetical protein
MKKLLLTVVAVAATATFLTPAEAQRPRPVREALLGCKAVGFISDRDVIRFARREGPFRAIQLRVQQNDIKMQDLKVVYGNGQIEDLAVRTDIARGGTTRWIDLRGDRRFLSEVRMQYASRPSFRGLARVCVYAR